VIQHCASNTPVRSDSEDKSFVTRWPAERDHVSATQYSVLFHRTAIIDAFRSLSLLLYVLEQTGYELTLLLISHYLPVYIGQHAAGAYTGALPLLAALPRTRLGGATTLSR